MSVPEDAFTFDPLAADSVVGKEVDAVEEVVDRPAAEEVVDKPAAEEVVDIPAAVEFSDSELLVPVSPPSTVSK